MSKNKKKYAIGIDVGGTKMAAVLYDGKEVVSDFSLATPKDSLDHFMIMLNALVEPLLEKAKEMKVGILGLGIGVPSVMNIDRQKILRAPNLNILDGVDLVERIQNMISLPVVMDNDVNCFLLGEVLRGVGQKYKNVYGLTIGTGIGGAWWINNTIYRGAMGGGGEPASMIVDFKDKMSWEEAYQKLTQNNPAAMAEEAFRGDVLAEKAYTELGDLLGIGLANIVNLIEPEALIIGGGTLESGALFFSHLKKSMRAHIISPDAKKKLKLEKAKLSPYSGAIGAACLVEEDIDQ